MAPLRVGRRSSNATSMNCECPGRIGTGECTVRLNYLSIARRLKYSWRGVIVRVVLAFSQDLWTLPASCFRSSLMKSRRSTVYRVRELAPAFPPEACFRPGNASLRASKLGCLQSGGKPPHSRDVALRMIGDVAERDSRRKEQTFSWPLRPRSHFSTY